jgi:hypothetical protein
MSVPSDGNDKTESRKQRCEIQCRMGLLDSLALSMPFQDPINNTSLISADDAKQIVNQFILQQQITDIAYDSSMKVVIFPNNFWQNTSTVTPVQSRVVWIVLFKKEAPILTVTPAYYEFWVDVESGEIIGGIYEQHNVRLLQKKMSVPPAKKSKRRHNNRKKGQSIK